MNLMLICFVVFAYQDIVESGIFLIFYFPTEYNKMRNFIEAPIDENILNDNNDGEAKGILPDFFTGTTTLATPTTKAPSIPGVPSIPGLPSVPGADSIKPTLILGAFQVIITPFDPSTLASLPGLIGGLPGASGGGGIPSLPSLPGS